MTADEIVTLAVTDYLDDDAGADKDKGWTPATLERYLNLGQMEAVTRAELIRDRITPTDSAGVPLCQLSIVAGQSTYLVSKKIFRIEDGKAYLSSNANYRMIVRTEDWLDDQYPGWRTETGTPQVIIQGKGTITLVPQPVETDTLIMPVVRLPLADMTLGGITLTGASDISFDAATSTITTVSGNFLSGGFQPGQEISISGTASNNLTVTPSAVTRRTLTVYETLTDEADTSAVLTADSIPEISEEYHFGLIHWICKLAYSKQDQETEDAAKKLWHDAEFTKAFGPQRSAQTQENRRNLPAKGRMRDKEFGFS